MKVIIISLLVIAYFVIGRVFINLADDKGWLLDDDTETGIVVFFWPLVLLWIAFRELGDWISDLIL